MLIFWFVVTAIIFFIMVAMGMVNPTTFILFLIAGIPITCFVLHQGCYIKDYKEGNLQDLKKSECCTDILKVYLTFSVLPCACYTFWCHAFPFAKLSFSDFVSPFIFTIVAFFTTWSWWEVFWYAVACQGTKHEKRRAILNGEEYDKATKEGRTPKYKYIGNFDLIDGKYCYPDGMGETFPWDESLVTPYVEPKKKKKRVSSDEIYAKMAADTRKQKIKFAEGKIREAERDLKSSVKSYNKGDGVLMTRKDKERAMENARKKLENRKRELEDLKNEQDYY